MSGGKSARREARAAAEESRKESEVFRQQSLSLSQKADAEAKRAQRLLIRALRARGSGYFETDFTSQNQTLGGGGVLG